MKWFILAFFISSCNYSIPHHIDPYFNNFIQHFIIDSSRIGIGDFHAITVIQFDNNMQEPEIGVCIRQHEEYLGESHSYKQVNFNPIIKSYDLSLQYKVFLHEMGHCAYSLSHVTDKDSIMYPYIIPLNYDYEIKLLEFFKSAEDNRENWQD